jgi:hypothetical protein
MNYMKSKRGIAPILIIGIGLAFLLVFYFILAVLPATYFPALASLRSSINYFLILALWILIQAGILYAIYEVISKVSRGFNAYKQKVLRLDFKIKRWLLFN